MNKKTGIRAKLMSYLAIVGALCVLVILFSNFTVSDNLENSRLFFDCNKNLSDFYSNITEMDTVARNYLYERTGENYDEFLRLLEAARGNLETIAVSVDDATQWRIERLENMLDYYCEPMRDFIGGETSVYDTYNALYYRKNLITNTATTYYGHLANYMKFKTDSMQAMWERQRNLQFVLLAVVAAFAVAMGGVYGKGIYAPISAMVENTKRLKKGNYCLEPIETNLAELGILADSFTEMAASVEKSVGALKENARLEYALLKQENDNLAMQNLVTEAELHSLQAQINPHFLFNTLSMISKSAYISGDTTTSELMDKLSEFLRYALDKANKNSTLYEEIESIKNYIFIQQKRFSGRIRFEVDVEPDAPNIPMPAIVLQPLMENAILHGASAMTEEALIAVKIHRFRDRVHIHIEDNGAGMRAEDLEALQSKLKMGLESSPGSRGSGIGLTNVYRRLQMYFGAGMQFSIDSEEGCGTVVTVAVPIEENLE